MTAIAVPDEPYLVPAVARAGAVVELIARDGPSTLAGIVDATGLNKSTAYSIARTLVAIDLLRHDDERRTYELGVGLVSLGAAARDRFDDVQLAKHHLQPLLERLDATIVFYRRLDPFTVMLVDKLELPHRLRITVPVGGRLPIGGGSFGRAFLAYSDGVDAVLERGLEAFTSRSVTDPDQFRREIASVRETGYAVDREGFALGVSTIAAPVFDATGEVALVAAAVAFSGVLTDDVIATAGPELAEACAGITHALGGDR
jgi:DNA-binding IclR family transcriptional regulator